MFAPDQYRLIDFGDGRKLESFGTVWLDRPAPAARGARQAKPVWSQAHARFTGRSLGSRGTWDPRRSFEQPWTLTWGPDHLIRIELNCNPFGHVGVFPEQSGNWRWLLDTITQSGDECRVLNLFAYTGAATLVAAAAGATVTHVDAAASIVKKARRNAELSDLHDHAIHWIVEDAVRYVERECRRGRRYQGIILDPPAYGRGGRGRSWQLRRDLPKLIAGCLRLLQDEPRFFLLSCHEKGWGPRELRGYLRDNTDFSWVPATQFVSLEVSTDDGRKLPSGVAARWSESL